MAAFKEATANSGFPGDVLTSGVLEGQDHDREGIENGAKKKPRKKKKNKKNGKGTAPKGTASPDNWLGGMWPTRPTRVVHRWDPGIDEDSVAKKPGLYEKAAVAKEEPKEIRNPDPIA